MKKTLAILLAITLMFSMSSTVLAAGSSDPNGTGAISGGSENDVKVTVTGVPGTAGKIYYLEITWDLEFTYTYGGGSEVWNPVDHEYSVENGGDAKWTKSEGSIKVTNHSNDDVTVTPSFKSNNGKNDGVEATLGNALTLTSADIDGVATSGTITVTVAGQPTKSNGTLVIDTVKLTIS